MQSKFTAQMEKIEANAFEKISISNTKVVEENGRSMLEVYSEHSFTQAVGYIKYRLKDSFTVMYRGQTRYYDTLKPSIFRSGNTIKAISERNKQINDLIKGLPHLNTLDRSVSDYACEPLLQHYGINTRWIDLVDNHWIALWFSAHKFFLTKDEKFMHFEKRRLSEFSEDFGYVILVATPKYWMNQTTPGLYKDFDCQLIDLRATTPSFYLRPHAQHAFLMRRNTYANAEDIDLSNRICGVIRIPLDLILRWLGTGGLISGHSLFPPPYYDIGYMRMLQNSPKFTKELSTIKSLSIGDS